MSLAIDLNTVTEVLLGDGWHTVADNSFMVDVYEFVWSGISGFRVAEIAHLRAHANRGHSQPDCVLVHGGGNDGICGTGFAFKDETGTFFYGPLTTILALKATD